MSGSVFGGLNGLLHTFVHTHAPHTPAEFYLVSMIGALLFAGAGYMIGLARDRQMPAGVRATADVHIANLGSGSSFPIYLLMPLVPFDEHLLAALAQSWFTVALAGFIGAGITLRSLWRRPQAGWPHAGCSYRPLPSGNANTRQRAYADLR